MKIETPELAVTILTRAIPYSEQITFSKITTESIYFTWRYDTLKLELHTGSVYELKDGCLHGSNIAILLTELVKQEHVKHF